MTYVSSLDGGGFNAYDARSGKLLWTYNDGEAVAAQGNNGPLIVAGSGGQAYYYHADLASHLAPNLPMVAALDSATGAIQVRLTLSEIGRPYLVTTDGDIYTTQDNQLRAFQLAGGERLWRAASIDGMDGSLRLVPSSAGLLYSRIVNDHVEVGALDNATGKQIWSWQGPAALYSAANSLSLAGDKDMLYLATRDGMYAFSASTSKMVWHAIATTDLSFVQPILAG